MKDKKVYLWVLYFFVGMVYVWPVCGKAGSLFMQHKAVDEEWVNKLSYGLKNMMHAELFNTSQLGMCVYDITTDTLLFEHASRQRMRPASTQKIITAITALSVLGKNYQYHTSLNITGQIMDSVLEGDVYVVGAMDPLFKEKQMRQFVHALQKQGIDSIHGSIYADCTIKDTLKWGWGWCWDDKNPSLSPLLYKGKDVFISTFIQQLAQAGVACSDTCTSHKRLCPSTARQVAVSTTKLTDVLRPMLKDSDNQCAESMFYHIAASSQKNFAGREDAVQVIERLFGDIGYDIENYQIADGSGLSLYNYLSAQLEVAFLIYAHQRKDIYYPFYHALPIAGEDGTLHRRMRNTSADGRVRAKTGTLEGVSSLTGYAHAANGHLIAFSIINQGGARGAEARAFQDKVCQLICQ